MQLKNKSWYKSKTIWVAVASLGVAVASAIWGETSPLVAFLIAVFSALGIYGRASSTTGIKIK